MTGSSRSHRTGLCLLALLLACCLDVTRAVPQPIPAEFFLRESYINNAEDNYILLNKLKQVIEERKDMAEREKALADVQREIQTVLEARARSRAQQADYVSAEELPPPNAIVSQPIQHSGKRTAISYMTLCHFKICNMGRKRQLRK